MEYVPYHKLGETPNIIVDGGANPYTLLTLSHWPKSGTPPELKDDLSAQIVFRYLDSPKFHVAAEAVSNNHFDEDGLVSLYSVLNPEEAQQNRELLIDISSAGDFGTYRLPRAVRIFFAISGLADSERSTLPGRIFDQDHDDQAASLYNELLKRLPEMIREPDSYKELWEEEEARLHQAEEAIRQGMISIEEVPAVDLAIITIPKSYPTISSIALHNATSCFRILMMTGNAYEFYFRYETWVQYISRRPLPRVDLRPLAKQLTSMEGSDEWTFDGVDQIVPHLKKRNDPRSNISPVAFREKLIQYLDTAESAWSPFD